MSQDNFARGQLFDVIRRFSPPGSLPDDPGVLQVSYRLGKTASASFNTDSPEGWPENSFAAINQQTAVAPGSTCSASMSQPADFRPSEHGGQASRTLDEKVPSGEIS